jgi:hypothetical protein
VILLSATVGSRGGSGPVFGSWVTSRRALCATRVIVDVVVDVIVDVVVNVIVDVNATRVPP